MIPSFRRPFNANYTPGKYRNFLKRMEERCGVAVEFRIAETPCFFSKTLLDKMAKYGAELIEQLQTPEYHAASAKAIPAEFHVPREDPHPMFIQVDFGLVRDANGELQPKLVELQGFPSLYGYQAILSQAYIDSFDLDPTLKYLHSGLNWERYQALLKAAIVAGHDPENVVLMEIDPLHQKTRPDFLVTEKLLGIPAVDIADIQKQGKRLFYEKAGKRIPIHRIYNRAIVDELVRKGPKLKFRLADDLDVEWAGHPNWYFRMSKFSLPFLRHECVPKTYFLNRMNHIPDDLHDYVLKPLFSFAGLGVLIGPSKEELTAIPQEKRGDYILQQKMSFEPAIDTPFGPTKAEIRIMYIWLDRLLPVLTIVRMGRGLMMGVDHNKNMEWVGSSAGFYSEK